MKPITYLTGDATAPQGEGRKIIGHCCNNIGVWGAGFVLAISKKWPEPEQRYRKLAAYEVDEIPLGRVQFVAVAPGLEVANIIGQKGVGYVGGIPPVRYVALGIGFAEIAARAIEFGASVHFPRLGCGIAGGQWPIVEALIVEQLCALNVPVYVYDFV